MSRPLFTISLTAQRLLALALVGALVAGATIVGADAPVKVAGQVRLTDGGISGDDANFTELITSYDPKGAYSRIVTVQGSNYIARTSEGFVLINTTNASAAIQEAIDSLTDGSSKGRIAIRAGTYTLNWPITVPDDYEKRISIQGEGLTTTTLVQSAASKNIFSLGNRNIVDIADLTMELPSTGSTGSCIEAGSSGNYGLMQSRLERIECMYGDSSHYGIKITNPFFVALRSVRLHHVENGLALVQDHASNNFGNSLVEDLQVNMEDSGTAILVESVTGTMNLNTFNRLSIWTYTQSVGSKGIYVKGSDTRYNHFSSFNLENVDTGIQVEGSANTFSDALVRATGQTNAALYSTSASRHNSFTNIYLNGITGETNTVGLKDDGGAVGGANRFEHIRLGTNPYTTPFNTNPRTSLANLMDSNRDAAYNAIGGNLSVNGTEMITATGQIILKQDLDANSKGISNVRTITVENTGAGSDPTITSASASDLLTLSGSLKLGSGSTLYPTTDGSGTIGWAGGRWAAVYTDNLRVLSAANDAQPAVQLTATGIQWGAGGSSSVDVGLSRSAANVLALGSDDVLNPAVGLDWTTTTLGTCDSSIRGREAWVEGGAGVADKKWICGKKADDAYAWGEITITYS